MPSKNALFFVLIFVSQALFSQVSLEKNKLLYNGTKYKYAQYEEVFKKPEARQYFAKARSNKTVAQIIGFTGGLAIGGGLGEIVFNSKATQNHVMGYTYETRPDHSVAWLITGIGVGLVGISIPFALAANKNAKKAVKTENGEEVTTTFRPHFNLKTAGNGLALTYHF